MGSVVQPGVVHNNTDKHELSGLWWLEGIVVRLSFRNSPGDPNKLYRLHTCPTNLCEAQYLLVDLQNLLNRQVNSMNFRSFDVLNYVLLG